MAALLEGLDKKSGKREEDEKEKQTPQKDDAEEKDRVPQQFSKTISGIEFSNRSRHNLPVANRPWVNRPPRLQMAVKLTLLRGWEELTIGELQQGFET